MKNQVVFKIEKNPPGFNVFLAPDCEIKIITSAGLLYLNYEQRQERAVGSYKNLRREGDTILADVELFKNFQDLEERFDYSISGAVVGKNDFDEASSIVIQGVGALMENKD